MNNPNNKKPGAGVGVIILKDNKVLLGKGEARTKKEAQQKAAEMALDKLEKTYSLFSITK